MSSVCSDALLNLKRELARRRQDEDADWWAGGVATIARRRTRDDRMAVGESLEDREDERGRLAGPGLGPGEKIAAGEDEGDRLTLDGGGLGVALVRDGAEQFGRQPENIEGHWKQQLLTGPSRYAAGPGQGVGWIGIGRYWTGALTGAPIEHESRSLPDDDRSVERARASSRFDDAELAL